MNSLDPNDTTRQTSKSPMEYLRMKSIRDGRHGEPRLRPYSGKPRYGKKTTMTTRRIDSSQPQRAYY